MSLKDRLAAANAALDETPQITSPAAEPAQAEGVGHRAPPASAPVAGRPFQPRTGPGGLLASMDQLRIKDREIGLLQQKLAEWADAQPARRIDPALIDLSAYAKAQAEAGALFGRPEEWAKKAIVNMASSGKFSADRTIAGYAEAIWKVRPCPVP